MYLLRNDKNKTRLYDKAELAFAKLKMVKTANTYYNSGDSTAIPTSSVQNWKVSLCTQVSGNSPPVSSFPSEGKGRP